jgi:predicted aspartyl protease
MERAYGLAGKAIIAAMAILLILPPRGYTQVPDTLMEYAGTYTCMQEGTFVILRVVRTYNAADPNVVFNFGPDNSNPNVPAGSFWLHGDLDGNAGRLLLTPVRWNVQPPGYLMIGLAGASRDGGNTFEGHIVGGVGCTSFSIHRTYIATTLTAREAPPRTEPPRAAPSRAEPPVTDARHTEVPVETRGGISVVPVRLNNALTLDFMIDSGASDVVIPADVILTLMRTGTLQPSDFVGSQNYRLADGSTVPSARFRLRVLKVGNREVRDVIGSVSPVHGALLLGQTFLGCFSSWSINNQRHVLVLE